MTAQYRIIPSGSIQCNSVVVWDDETLEAILIDPTDDARLPLEFIARQQLKVSRILLTHAHFDHAADAEGAAKALDVPLYLHPNDLGLYQQVAEQAAMFGFRAKNPTAAPKPLAEGDEFRISDQYKIVTLHVPGHSPGCVAFYVAGASCVFAGDTLFAGSVGRTDLPGGSSEQLRDSIRNKLYQLPDDCVVVSGHGPTTTIGEEKLYNSFVRA
jgi:glyoxylase-like metal-dependent hydrolase (beta-lactamase superfamily II)